MLYDFVIEFNYEVELFKSKYDQMYLSEYKLVQLEANSNETLFDFIKRIKKKSVSVILISHRMEDNFAASEEDFYIAAIDAGLDEREAGMQRDDLYAAHINDQTLVNLKQCIEYNKRRAVALKQDREIYLFYLKQNEEEQ